MPTEQTPQLIFLDIILMLLLFVTLRRALFKPYTVRHSQYKFAVFLCLMFCLFSFWGSDWFHYIDVFEKLKKGQDSHVENIYFFIASISPNYLFFRLIIWGSAIYLFLDIINRCSISKDLAFLFFCCMYLTTFSYARASLAMVMAFYGYSLLLKPYKNKHYSTVLGIIAICCSFYFHKSSLFAVATVTLCMLIRRYPTKMILFILLMYPILIALVKYQLADVVSSDIDENESTLNSYMSSSQHYLVAKSKARGIAAYIMGKLETIPYYMISIISFFVLKNHRKSVPNDIKAFMLLDILLLIFSSIFMFDLGFMTGMFYGRFIKFMAMPSSIVFAYLYQSRLYPRSTKIAVYIAFLSTAYALSYSFYCSIVGG